MQNQKDHNGERKKIAHNTDPALLAQPGGAGKRQKALSCGHCAHGDEDRKENIRRVGEVASLMADAGLVVLTAFISPHRAERQMVRERVGRNRFIEVFVDTPLEVCEARDPKGLYKKARAGELRNFTGIDAVYEAPESPEIHLEGQQLVTNLVSQLLDLLRRDDIIRS